MSTLSFGDCLRLLRGSPLPPTQRWGLLAAYARLARSKGPGSVSLLGRPVRFPDGRFASTLFREIFIKHSYYIRGMSTSGRILDCGSNVGFSILYFSALYPKHRIVGFEPNPEAFEFLRWNCEEKVLDQIELHQAAVGPTDGELTFYKGNNGIGSPLGSSLKVRAGGESIKVKQRSLAPFLEEPVALLKVDIEGAEGALFDQLFRDDSLQQVERMVVEFHHNLPGVLHELSWFLTALSNAGFRYQLAADYDLSLRTRHGPRFQDVTVYAFRQHCAPLPKTRFSEELCELSLS